MDTGFLGTLVFWFFFFRGVYAFAVDVFNILRSMR